VDRKAWPLDIRWSDLVTVAIVIAVIELNIVVGGGEGAGTPREVRRVTTRRG
jgi:hypothetical protein